jgi:hypothetical protein
MKKLSLDNGAIVRPIIEFLPLFSEESARGAGYVLFHPTKDDGETPHPYLDGVKAALKKVRGIYVFYDSRGRAIYAGKTVEQSLWGEMNSAYNRDRGESQQTWRVKHPMIRPHPYDPDQNRVVGRENLLLHELAAYASAYEVLAPFISEMEALLVRGFANDLLNKKMEKFAVEKE